MHTYIPPYLPTYITYIPYIHYIHTYITLHYITLHNITYIHTLHYITLLTLRTYIHTYIRTYARTYVRTLHIYICTLQYKNKNTIQNKTIHYITLHTLMTQREYCGILRPLVFVPAWFLRRSYLGGKTFGDDFNQSLQCWDLAQGASKKAHCVFLSLPALPAVMFLWADCTRTNWEVHRHCTNREVKQVREIWRTLILRDRKWKEFFGKDIEEKWATERTARFVKID
jgi:hypothetical protein